MAWLPKFVSFLAFLSVTVVSGRRILDEAAVNPGKLQTNSRVVNQPDSKNAVVGVQSAPILHMLLCSKRHQHGPYNLLRCRGRRFARH